MTDSMELEDESAVDALEQHGPKRLKLGAASHEAMRDLSGMAMIAMKATSYEGHESRETHAKKNGRDREAADLSGSARPRQDVVVGLADRGKTSSNAIGTDGMGQPDAFTF